MAVFCHLNHPVVMGDQLGDQIHLSELKPMLMTGDPEIFQESPTVLSVVELQPWRHGLVWFMGLCYPS